MISIGLLSALVYLAVGASIVSFFLLGYLALQDIRGKNLW